MNPQITAIAQRIRELREVLEVPAEQLAKKLHLDTQEYLNYEEGNADIPISFIYGVAAELHVDPTVLLTGDSPKMSACLLYTSTMETPANGMVRAYWMVTPMLPMIIRPTRQLWRWDRQANLRIP